LKNHFIDKFSRFGAKKYQKRYFSKFKPLELPFNAQELFGMAFIYMIEAIS
jgi:hypothetical protein